MPARTVNESVLSHGMDDTREALGVWRADGWRVLRGWFALSLCIALMLLAAVWVVSEVTYRRDDVNPIRFMTMSPTEHHQLLLVSGRKPDSDSTVAQISFLMEDFPSLRRLHERASAEPRIRNHERRDGCGI